MRTLRDESLALKGELETADPVRRSAIEERLADARREWRSLSEQRERAYIRKMISLGHLPPDADPGA